MQKIICKLTWSDVTCSRLSGAAARSSVEDEERGLVDQPVLDANLASARPPSAACEAEIIDWASIGYRLLIDWLVGAVITD